MASVNLALRAACSVQMLTPVMNAITDSYSAITFSVLLLKFHSVTSEDSIWMSLITLANLACKIANSALMLGLVTIVNSDSITVGTNLIMSLVLHILKIAQLRQCTWMSKPSSASTAWLIVSTVRMVLPVISVWKDSLCR